MPDFDFDHWAGLARRDPRAYFSARDKVIRRFIDGHPPAQAQRLWEMQAHIDCVRVVCATPGQATSQLSNLLEEHLQALHGAMDRLLQLTESLSRSLGKADPS